jgi:hypothetical protein
MFPCDSNSCPAGSKNRRAMRGRNVALVSDVLSILKVTKDLALCHGVFVSKAPKPCPQSGLYITVHDQIFGDALMFRWAGAERGKNKSSLSRNSTLAPRFSKPSRSIELDVCPIGAPCQKSLCGAATWLAHSGLPSALLLPCHFVVIDSFWCVFGSSDL